MKQQTFREGMKVLSATWPDRSPSKETAAAYWMVLSHLSDDVFMHAVGRCLSECRFFPVPAEILERAESALTHTGVLPDEPATAWERVMRAARGWHPGGETHFANPDIERTVRELGGMRAIACSSDDEIVWTRKEFLARYEQYRKRRIAAEPALMSQALPDGRDVAIRETVAAIGEGR